MNKTVEQIFKSPPSGPAELDQILSRLDEEEVRLSIYTMLEQGFFSISNYSLFSAVIAEVGVCEHREHLVEIVSDGSRDMLVRQFAIAALAQEDPDLLHHELGHLDPKMLQSLGDLPLIELMTMVLADPMDANQVTELIEKTPEEMWDLLIFNLGKCRRQAGTPAVFAYSHALAAPHLASVHQLMLDAVVTEGGDDGNELLIKLRDEADNDENRRRFQKALLKLGTSSIENTNAPPQTKGRVFVANCDGQGAYIMLGRFEVSQLNTVTANLCIRVSSDIRDGFVLPSQPDEEFDSMLRDIQVGALSDFVEISLGEASSLVTDAMSRTRKKGTQLLSEAKPSIRLFEKANPVSLPEISDCGTEDKDLIEPLRLLLKEKRVFTTWFFDMGDLLGSDVDPPEDLDSSEQWYTEAAIVLATTPIRDRVIAMLEYMCRWHLWNNDQENAQLLAATANEAKRDFATSAIVRIMLEKSLRRPDSKDDLLPLFEDNLDVGDPDIRGLLRIKFFSNLKWPRGKHLAQLDLTEVAFSTMDTAMNTLPAERRPREDEKLAIAFEIGKTVSKTILKNEDFDEEGMDKLIRRLSKMSILDKNEAAQIVTVILPKISEFFATVCEFCEVDCLARPDSKMSDAFFSDLHPGRD